MTEGLSVYLHPDDGPVVRALSDAVYQLLQTCTMDSLSISELVASAGISRSTFYRYFLDKYDLVNTLHLRVLEATLFLYFEGASFRDAVHQTWDVFTRHKRYYQNALASGDINSLGNFIFNQTDLFYRQVLDRAGIKMTKQQTRILRQYAFGSVALMSEWILGNMSESLEEYMQASLSGLPDFVRDLFQG